MVASLLASDPRKHDDLGSELLRDVSEVFGRQMEVEASPVSKDDVAEVLRRRFFEPESIRDTSARSVRTLHRSSAASPSSTHRPARSEPVCRGAVPGAAIPFHPDMTDVFYTRWTQLEGFQRTRGILRTFAIALRDAEKWDTCPLIGPNVFLNDTRRKRPGRSRQTSWRPSASVESGAGEETRHGVPILEGELAKARDIQAEATGLNHREIEQAVNFGVSELAAHRAQGAYPRADAFARRGKPGQDRAREGTASMDGGVVVPRRSGSGYGNREWKPRPS